MRKLLTYMVFIFGLTSFSFAPDFASEKYAGYAYDLETQKHIYTEVHTERFVNGKHIETTTNFLSPDGEEEIAKRTLDFTKSLISPDFMTTDLRSGYEEGSEQISKNLFRLFYKENQQATLREKTLHIPDPVVIDGGFNQFIKQHWGKILEGEEVTFHFAVPSRLDYYSFRVMKTNTSNKEITIEIQPEKVILRWLVDTISIDYDLETKRITQYMGRSNISNGHGENYVAKLIYPKKGP